jgi:hypothetical protein
MAEIIARFADGRLLVQEDKAVEQGYKMSGYSTYGVPVRIGYLKTVEKLLSLDAHMSGYPGIDGRVEAPLREVKMSGDTILVVLRRGDVGSPVMTGLLSGLTASGWLTSGNWTASGLCLSGVITLTGPITSGNAALGALSGITSGLGYWEELTSGLTAISGKLKIVANVIGF